MGNGAVTSHFVLILVILAYFGRFPACFGPFRKVQSLSTLKALQRPVGPEIQSYA